MTQINHLNLPSSAVIHCSDELWRLSMCFFIQHLVLTRFLSLSLFLLLFQNGCWRLDWRPPEKYHVLHARGKIWKMWLLIYSTLNHDLITLQPTNYLQLVTRFSWPQPARPAGHKSTLVTSRVSDYNNWERSRLDNSLLPCSVCLRLIYYNICSSRQSRHDKEAQISPSL